MAIVSWRLVMTVREPGHDPADHDPLAVERLVLEVARVRSDVPADLLGHLAHRVLREVQPEQLLLPAQPLADRDLGRRGQRPLEDLGVRRAEVEQRRLAGDPVALRGLRRRRSRRRAPSSSCAGWPNASSAPTLMSASSTLRFASRRSIRGAEVGERPERAALARARR